MNDASILHFTETGIYCEACNNILIPIDTSSVRNNYEQKYNKYMKQIENSPYHKGIFNLLERLDGQILSSQLPSQILHINEEPVQDNKNSNKIDANKSNSIYNIY